MPTPPSRALDKALDLLGRLAADNGRRSISDIAAEAGISVPTAYRLAATLERRGFLVRITRGYYLPGTALLDVAEATNWSQLIMETSRPIAQALSGRTHCLVQVGMLEEDMVKYLVKVGPGSNALFTREGCQFEAYCSGLGKALLAFQSPKERERYLDNGPFIRLTPNTIVEPPLLRDEFARVRRRGFAFDQGEMHPDVFCVAAPILKRDGVAIASMSVSQRSSPPLEARAQLMEAVSELTERLFQRSK